MCVLQSEEEFDQIITDDVIVYFTASWCGPCREISPHYTRAAEQYSNFKFAKVDVDDLDDTSNIAAVPTFRVYRSGCAVKEIIGADVGALETLLQRYCSSN